MSYGIYQDKKGVWFACVPKLSKDDGYKVKGFYPSKWKDPKAAAILWRDKQGREIWGVERWDLIQAYGAMAVRRLRSPVFGVAVYQALSGGSYDIWRVDWRDYRGEKKSETFSPKQCGTLEQAEINANLFAASKRAELTGGMLHRVQG